MGTSPAATHASAQWCAAMHVCLQSMCAAMQVCSHCSEQQDCSAVLCCQPSQCVRCQPGCRGTGEPAPGSSAREGASADSLSMAGRTCGLCLRRDRARRMSTSVGCRTSSAQCDRQGWASGGAGRGRSTARGGGTWAGRRARAQERGHAVPGEGMLGKS